MSADARERRRLTDATDSWRRTSTAINLVLDAS